MAIPKLIIAGRDLYALGLVTNIPDTIERVTFKRDKLISNEFKFKCKNKDNLLSVGNPNSIFSGRNWMYADAQYFNTDGINTWNGILININNNYRNNAVILHTRDDLFTLRNTYIDYTSSDWETAAETVKNILDANGTDIYDNQTLQSSIDYLTDNGALLKYTITKADKITIFNAIEAMALHCGADAWSHLNKIFFKVWRPFTGGVNINLNTDSTNRLKDPPIVNYLERDMINDYSIDYDGAGSPLTDSAAGNIGALSRSRYGTRSAEPMKTGTGEKIVFKDATTARFVGEQKIKRSMSNYREDPQPLIKIQFNLHLSFKTFIEIGNYFRLTFTQEAWNGKIFQTYEFRRNEDSRNINMVGYEIQ